MFDKFVRNGYRIVSVHSILFVFAHNTLQYVYDRYFKFQSKMFTLKKLQTFSYKW